MGANRTKGRGLSASSATARWTAEILERDPAPASLLDPRVGKRLNLEIHQIDLLEPSAVGLYRVTASPANPDARRSGSG